MKEYSLILLLLLSSLVWSQDYKFGKVSKAELEEAFYPLDSSANAAVLYKKRSTNFEFNKDNGGFYIQEKHHVRLKIYSSEAFNYATNKIKLYHDINGKEEVRSLKAVTYNLENNKIIKTNLKKSSVFDEELNKYYNLVKFTMPDVRAKTIIEWSYTKNTPFFGALDEVKLQFNIPAKRIETRIATPEYFNYNSLSKGHLKIPITKESRTQRVSYSENERSGGLGWQPVRTTTVQNKFEYAENIQNIVMDNVPAIKDEPYSGNIHNYTAGINYELSFIKYPNASLKNYATTWKSVVEKIYLSASFGDQLKKNKHFEEDIQAIIQNSKSIDEKIIRIFQHVKSKIKWNSYNGYYTEEGVKKAYKDGVGNVADINLNLVAMLQSAGLNAKPVLISTVKNGIPLFPTRHGFNYVIARVVSPNGIMLLDATDKNSVPNVLPERVLNFRGLVVSDNGNSDWIELFPTKHSLIETKINAKYTELGFTGTARKKITNQFLLRYRNATADKSQEDMIEWIDDKTEGVDVINARVANLDKLGKDAIETIQFETESYCEDINNKTYLTPLLYLQQVENEFKSENREFSVFYNKPWALISIINILIPENYLIENVPESVDYLLPDDLGLFRYNIAPNGQNIEIKSSLLINQAVITANYYQDLKDFFNKIITKQKEKIVLTKK